MSLADDVIPAAAHLAGPGSRAVLRAALTPFDGRLVSARPCHVHYRPGHDVAVRYDATVSWSGGSARPETLLAGATRRGVPAGTLSVEGRTDQGEQLAVGVWRWPFDPRLPGLPVAVTPSRAAAALGGLATAPVRLTVLAYRPTQRAVVRVEDATGRVVYVKVVRPEEAGDLVLAHERMAAAGVSVPTVLASDAAAGLVVLQALDGTTARERYQSATAAWPRAGDYRRLFAAIASADLSMLPTRAGRLADALGHAAMLTRVVPTQQGRLDELAAAVSAGRDGSEARRLAAVHGDLYEAQLVTATDRPRITGLLDLDDAGPGDPLDDRATVLAHLWVRALDASHRRRLLAHLAELRTAFVEDHGPAALDLSTAAVLVGLATGPFRTQTPGWRARTARILARAGVLAAGRAADENPLSPAS